METSVRPLNYQSSYGNLFGTYVVDAQGDLYALIARFETVDGRTRPVNYRLAAADLDDDLLTEALNSVVLTEAQRPT